MTADAPTPDSNAVSLLAASLKFESMAPSLTTLMGSHFTDVTSSLGSLVLKQFDTSHVSMIATEMASSLSVSKLVADHYAANVGSIGQALAQLYRTEFNMMSQSVDLKKMMEAVSRSFEQSAGLPSVISLLSQAASLQGILEDQPDVERFSADFLEEQPELAEAIEELPVLVNLSSAERKLIVWFVGVVVSIYVTLGLVTINGENPDLHSILGDLGIAGPAAGIAVGKGTKKLLDKLPPVEGD